ncbi:hypothetical protein RUM44_009979 [Polyplax serrata]|uniref:Uncharacterized protein n=1 Tax=Polyplax serrata TaxID=468196 RepID=A0ABR1AUU4_POLSC
MSTVRFRATGQPKNKKRTTPAQSSLEGWEEIFRLKKVYDYTECEEENKDEEKVEEDEGLAAYHSSAPLVFVQTLRKEYSPPLVPVWVFLLIKRFSNRRRRKWEFWTPPDVERNLILGLCRGPNPFF